MLKKLNVKSFSIKIDVRKLKGTGDFLCSYCGNTIFPDDETEEAYRIVETKIKEDYPFEEVIINCIECNNLVHIFGFELLTDIRINEFSQYNNPQIFVENLLHI
jgi:hypothetical protein